MEIIISKNHAESSHVAALLIAKLVEAKPTLVLGLASGESPKLLYQELIRMENSGSLDLSRVTCFSLDEYLGLGASDKNSYRNYYDQNFLRKLKSGPRAVHFPNGLAADVEHHCMEYEKRIQEAGGIDCQILGIGLDGHIAFNEPGSSLASRTRVKTLTPQTLKANQKHFKDKKKIPKHVLTMGVGTIMEVGRCVVLASSAKKAGAIAATVEGPITASCPASVLQMHPHAHLFLDGPAAARLKRKAYYKFVYENKPDWQRL